MFFDRIDVLEAWYVYCTWHHTGQGSPEYRAIAGMWV